MSKKRIAVIGLKGLPSYGGAARVGEGVIEQLKDEFDFTVYATSSHAQKEGDIGGYQQIVFKKLSQAKLNVFYYYLISGLHALFFGKYDLVHLHHVDGAFIIPLLRLRYKVIGTSHGRPQERDKWMSIAWYFKTVEQIFLRMCNTATSVAKPLADTYSTMVKRPILYIPNGIHLKDKVDDKVIEQKDYLMFSAGRIMATKGCHTFLEALHKLKYKGKILIVGDLDQIPGYAALIRNLAGGLNVDFIPLIKEKPVLLNYVKNAKLFIFPSTIEAMSIMMLEVATMKTPLICSDIVENKAVFSQAETLFFETENSDDLAEKIKFALDKPEEMQKLTNSAYDKLCSSYSWSSVAKDYAKQFNLLMS